MKLQRTDKQLTERDAIELAEAIGLENGDKYKECHYGYDCYWYDVKLISGAKVSIYVEDLSCYYLHEDGKTAMFLDSLVFTNKALELGYYEIVE